MTLIVLGSGTSHGVPMIGCSCPTCTSADPRDARTNASLLISVGGKNILIDCGRDFRQQALRHAIDRVDHVLLTHTHFDHIAGIDDLRVFTAARGEPIPVYGRREHLEYLESRIFHYLFDPKAQRGGGIAQLDLVPLNGAFSLGRLRIEPIPVRHGCLEIVGYRFGDCAYLSDVSAIPRRSMEKLHGLDLLILGALRHRAHPTHFNISQALEVVERLRPRQTYFTHICHDVLHEEVDRQLAAGEGRYAGRYPVRLAYDGLTLTL